MELAHNTNLYFQVEGRYHRQDLQTEDQGLFASFISYIQSIDNSMTHTNKQRHTHRDADKDHTDRHTDKL